MRGQRNDARAFVAGIAAVQHQHRDVLLDGRQNRRGMQNLGAKVCKFSSLFKADDLDAQRIGTHARIGRHDAVHVGPDLDGFGVHGAANQRAGKVGAAAAERGGDAGFVRPDEAAHHRHLARIDQRAHFFVGALFDDGVDGNRLLKLRVGDDHVARVHVRGIRCRARRKPRQSCGSKCARRSSRSGRRCAASAREWPPARAASHQADRTSDRSR